MAFVEAALIIEAEIQQRTSTGSSSAGAALNSNSRVLKNADLRADQAQQRIAAQMPVEEKRRMADDVIDCSGSFEETERQAAKLVEKLKLAGAAGRNIS